MALFGIFKVYSKPKSDKSPGFTVHILSSQLNVVLNMVLPCFIVIIPPSLSFCISSLNVNFIEGSILLDIVSLFAGTLEINSGGVKSTIKVLIAGADNPPFEFFAFAIKV